MKVIKLILVIAVFLLGANIKVNPKFASLHVSALRPQATGIDLQKINFIKSAKPISPQDLIETDFFKVIFKRYPELKPLIKPLVDIEDNEMAQQAFKSVASFSDQDILRMLDSSLSDNGSIRSYVLSHDVTVKQIFLFPTLGYIDIGEWLGAPLSSLGYGSDFTADKYMYGIYEKLYAALVVLYRYAIDRDSVLIDVDDINVITSYMQEVLADQKRESEELHFEAGYLPKMSADNIKRLIDLSTILIPADTQSKRESILNLMKVIDILRENDPLWQKAFDDVTVQRYALLDSEALEFMRLYNNRKLRKALSRGYIDELTSELRRLRRSQDYLPGYTPKPIKSLSKITRVPLSYDRRFEERARAIEKKLTRIFVRANRTKTSSSGVNGDAKPLVVNHDDKTIYLRILQSA